MQCPSGFAHVWFSVFRYFALTFTHRHWPDFDHFLQSPVATLFNLRVLLVLAPCTSGFASPIHAHLVPFCFALLFLESFVSINPALGFQHTPITTPFDLRVLLAFSTVSVVQTLYQLHERLVLLCLLFCSHNPALASIPNHPPANPSLQSFRCSCPAILILNVLSFGVCITNSQTLGQPLSALLSSQSYIDINLNLSLFSTDSQLLIVRPPCTTRLLLDDLSSFIFIKIDPRLVLLCLLCCFHNHALTSILMSLFFLQTTISLPLTPVFCLPSSCQSSNPSPSPFLAQFQSTTPSVTTNSSSIGLQYAAIDVR